jgi:hypothetical protein
MTHVVEHHQLSARDELSSALSSHR